MSEKLGQADTEWTLRGVILSSVSHRPQQHTQVFQQQQSVSQPVIRISQHYCNIIIDNICQAEQEQAKLSVTWTQSYISDQMKMI